MTFALDSYKFTADFTDFLEDLGDPPTMPPPPYVAFDLKDPSVPQPIMPQPVVPTQSYSGSYGSASGSWLLRQPRPSKTDHDGVRAQLNRLETLGSPSAIADFFRRESVKGTPGSSHGCSIARWLTASCGLVSVGYRQVRDPNSRELIAMLPGAALVFAQNFDRQLYPDLIAS